VIVAGHLLGARLYADDPLVHIGAPPLVGSFDLRLSAQLGPALALGAGAVVWAPALAARLRWPRLLPASWAAASAWAVALAASGGWGAVSAPLRSRFEALTAVPLVGSPGRFLSTFTDLLPTYATHVKGHPPGFVLLLWGLDGLGLGGATAATVLVIAGGALVAPAALVALRALTDERGARAAAPFLAFAPAAVWMGTSADGLFAGVSASGVALFALACTVRRSARARTLAVGAGVVLGGALFLSYGIAPLAAVVVAIAVGRRRPGVVVWAGAGGAAVFVGFLAARFNWLDGLSATRELYAGGVAHRRPYAEFLVIDLAAFALAVGPAAVAGLARLRERGVWLLAAGALVALAAADLSGMSRGETERIWLPFVPWLLVATAALGGARGWLAAQVALGLALQVGVRSPW